MLSTKSSICVGLGELKVSRDPNARLSILGLGSCIAVCVYCTSPLVASMAHVVLPNMPKDWSLANNPELGAKYADFAIPYLVSQMRSSGARISQASVVLCGGASIFRSVTNSSLMDIGSRNLEAVRSGLHDSQIPIELEEVGGNESRTIHLDVGSGQVIVRTLRQGERVIHDFRQSTPVVNRI